MHGAASGRPSPWVERIFVKDSTHTYRKGTRKNTIVPALYSAQTSYFAPNPLYFRRVATAWRGFLSGHVLQINQHLARLHTPPCPRHSPTLTSGLLVRPPARWQLTQLETKLIVKPHRARIGCTATALCTQCTHKHTLKFVFKTTTARYIFNWGTKYCS